MNKRLLLTVAATGIMGAGLVGATGAFAQSTVSPQEHRAAFIQKITDRFKLNKDEVQKVFDEERHSARLDQLVKDGTITEAQKQLILKKHEELQAQHEQNRASLQTMTPEQRKAAVATKKQELETWAKNNGIDPQYLGFFGKRGFGMKHMMNVQ